MIYLAFTFWLFMILFAGVGVYRLWTQMVRPLYVNWALLPGTFVSEMAYIFGCLVTGGEIRRVQLVPRRGEGRRGGDGEPVTEDTPRLKVVGPAIASLCAVLGVLAGLICLYSFLETPAIRAFVIQSGQWSPFSDKGLPRELPTSWSAFWQHLKHQLDLLRGMLESWGELPWSDWRVPVFVYLAACLSIRLAPVGRDLRWTLAAMVLVAALIALAGLVSKRFDGLIRDGDVWYFVTYIWTLLLFLLVMTLLVRGLIALIGVLSGRKIRRGGH